MRQTRLLLAAMGPLCHVSCFPVSSRRRFVPSSLAPYGPRTVEYAFVPCHHALPWWNHSPFSLFTIFFLSPATTSGRFSLDPRYDARSLLGSLPDLPFRNGSPFWLSAAFCRTFQGGANFKNPAYEESPVPFFWREI